MVSRNKITQIIMLVWLCFGFLFWAGVIFFTKNNSAYYGFIYFYFIVLGVGPLIYFKRHQIENKLQKWKINAMLKFLSIGLLTVLFEEILAAFVHHLKENFDLVILLKRIFQFSFLNFFIFIGFYLAWYFLIQKYQYTKQEIFFLSGLWGLYTENVINSIFKNPILFFTISPIVIFVYGLMISLPMLSIKFNGRKQAPKYFKYFITYVFIFGFSLIPLMVLFILKNNYPQLFPPTYLIN